MTTPRPSARTPIGVLIALMLVSAIAAPVALGRETANPPAVANPDLVCSPGQLPTRWRDELHAPQTIRVLRSNGPHAGHVETVAFWWYVGVVMRAEYSNGATKPPLWMRMGAITVKQYAWYKTIFWGGGRVSFTVIDPVTNVTTTTSECYDVKDTTADQIYRPEKWDPVNNVWEAINTPTVNIELAMRETWHMTLRKWDSTKNATKLFLSGYRTGQKAPCGTDSTGYKIYQQSMHDCAVKNLTTYETLRHYFEPTYIVSTRDHDMLGNSLDWVGDLGVLSRNSSGKTAWRLYSGGSNQFAAPVTGVFKGLNFNSIVGYGVGNVDGARSQVDDNPGDEGLLADLVMVTTASVLVSRAVSAGLSSSLISTQITTGAPDKVVIGDFNGDLLVDVGLVYFGSGTTLQVMTATGDGRFNAVQPWSGTLGLTTGAFVAAGDVNGDGKADLIVRDPAGAVSTAVSPPTCATPYTWGSCPYESVGANAVGTLTPALTGTVALGANITVGDYDRDGRSDLMVVASDGRSVQGMRGKADGTLFDAQVLWQTSAGPISGKVMAMNVDPDGMSDLAVVGSNSVSWLKTNEKTSAPASLTMMSSTKDYNLRASSRPF